MPCRYGKSVSDAHQSMDRMAPRDPASVRPKPLFRRLNEPGGPHCIPGARVFIAVGNLMDPRPQA